MTYELTEQNIVHVNAKPEKEPQRSSSMHDAYFALLSTGLRLQRKHI